MKRRWSSLLPLLALLPIASSHSPVAAAPIVPANFVVEDAVPGANFVVPTAIAPLPDGRLLVGEKQGRVWLVQNGVKSAQPLWSRPM